ncbi:hypothetical protein HYFRA_00001384 [Hymenoscyphus fraxineus]|uniref:Uncharacterized protein n=1 Tax=Hymenoscyphus fraxineus TaxID=746836 RepID=A0A9N9L3V3_9HELO|nr:hypothetical protein HYFRA_00001384 [Hymenoscyphus fraxineus]
MNTIKAIISFIRLRNRAQAQLPAAPTEPVLPVEILRQIWRESFVPRTVVFRRHRTGTSAAAGSSRYEEMLLEGRLDIPPAFPEGPGAGLSLEPLNPGILFNPEIDTLAVSSCQSHQLWVLFPRVPGANGEIWATRNLRHWLIDLPVSMAHLKSILHLDHTNLASTQAIALGNARWPPPRAQGHEGPFIAGFLGDFEASIQDSFRNLSKIILVRATRESFGCIRDFEDSLGSEAGRALCRQQIREMYERLQETDPGVKVPEVIILSADDPQAPDLGQYSDLTSEGKVYF